MLNTGLTTGSIMLTTSIFSCMRTLPRLWHKHHPLLPKGTPQFIKVHHALHIDWYQDWFSKLTSVGIRLRVFLWLPLHVYLHYQDNFAHKCGSTTL